MVKLDAKHSNDLARLHALSFRREEAWDAAAFESLLLQTNTRAFGVERDSTLAAFILVHFVQPEAEILTLATAPSFQRLGLAQYVLREAESQLREDGLEKWLLDVAEDNQPAIAFYRKLGFAEDGRRPRYYNRLEGSRIDAILMSKHLSRQETK
ncbi:MAG: GNAT family N-acetyltransferase [Pseudomonadota bacterium]